VLADAATLQDVLSHYPEIPETVAAAEMLTTLSSAPAVALFEYTYEQTPASVAHIAGEVTSLRDQIRRAEQYVPLGLLGAAVLSLVVGGLVYWRRRAPTIDLRALPPTAKPAPELQPVPNEHPRRAPEPTRRCQRCAKPPVRS
jgi:hypothetical protein